MNPKISKELANHRLKQTKEELIKLVEKYLIEK